MHDGAKVSDHGCRCGEDAAADERFLADPCRVGHEADQASETENEWYQGAPRVPVVHDAAF